MLDAACGGDAELRREVETLLSADEEAGSFGASIDGRVASAIGPSGRLTAGDQLGPYAVESRLGRGGMGDVFLARDTRLERLVAIKVLPGALGAQVAREAKAVAALNHPHICTLHDIGNDTS